MRTPDLYVVHVSLWQVAQLVKTRKTACVLQRIMDGWSNKRRLRPFLRGPEVGPGVRTGWRDQMDRSLFTMQLGRGVGGFSGRGAWSIRCFPFVQTGSQTANKQNESTHCWSNRAVNTIPCCTELGTQGIVCSCPQLLHRLMATDKQLLTVMTHTDCCTEVKLLLSWQSAP